MAGEYLEVGDAVKDSPTGIYDDAGPWVRYEDHAAVITALRTQQPAPAGFIPVAAFDRLHAHAESLAARLLAASPTPPAEQKACDTQLFKFYGVSTTAELIAAQARHIEKLQAKIPPTPSFAPQRVREG